MGKRCILRRIDFTGIMLVRHWPRCVSLDTLYIRLLELGVAGIGENHSMYARCSGGVMHECYDLDTFHFFSHMTHYLTHAGTSMTHTDSRLMTHYLRIVPYDIITDVTMMHADSRLLITYVIMTHS